MANGWYANNYGTVSHYVNDKLHNQQGPAIIYDSGSKHWFYQSKRIDCNSQIEFKRIIRLKLFW